MPAVTPPASQLESRSLSAERLISLDVARGMTVIGMIVVNNPGSWDVVFSVLHHAQWHGFMFVDLGFPAFLFLMGMATAYAYGRRRERGETRRALLRKAAWRAATLFAIGLVLEAFPFVAFDGGFHAHENLAHVRIPGVLQRIAVCSFATAVLFLYVRPRVQYVLAAAILLGYWALLVLVPVPGYGAGRLDLPEATLPAFVDRLVFGSHLYAGGTWDPEGLLSTFPALVTTLLGLWTGRMLRTGAPVRGTVIRLGLAGLVLAAAGCAWHTVLPVNKTLWTGSFVLLTGGLTLCIFTALYALLDVWRWRRGTQSLAVFGVNALPVYVLSTLADEVLDVLSVPFGTGSVSVRAFLFDAVFLPVASPVMASLLYALTWLAVWYAVMHYLYRKGVSLTV